MAERGRGRRPASLGRRPSLSPAVFFVVKKTVQDIGGAQYPILTRSNYAEWEVMMKARGLWRSVSVGTNDEQEDQMTIEAILKGVPTEFFVALGSKETAKEAWDSLKTMCLDNNRVRKVKAQQLHREYEAITFRDGEAVEDFALRLMTMVSQLGSLGDTITEEEAVTKFLRVVPSRFAQIAMSIETLLELSKLTIEDIVGRLKVVEDCVVDAPAHASAGSQLLLTEEQWAVRARE
ncbi:uncharacterized protein [Setaria viridis]|uniref:uncharacterized protein n=1 Tax=Setaria viridis TaxID=4556 RepID=UPI003B3BB0DD